MPLYYAPGEAYQFDWSHEIVVLNGVTTTVKVAPIAMFSVSVVANPNSGNTTIWGKPPVKAALR